MISFLCLCNRSIYLFLGILIQDPQLLPSLECEVSPGASKHRKGDGTEVGFSGYCSPSSITCNPSPTYCSGLYPELCGECENSIYT